jgi:LacI family transcriptional regulator
LATIYDVAARAGVSPKTVSRVLNGDAPVNARTREAVHRAMAELDYIPSSAARSMRSQKTGLVGMITGAISASPMPGDAVGLPEIFLVQSAQRVLGENGKTLLIADCGGQMARAAELAQTFLEHRVEGLIYVAEFHREVHLPESLIGRPVVLTNCFDAIGTPAVIPDDRGAQFALVDRLLRAGHSRVGFLTLPEGMVAQEQRLLGYRDAHEAHGLVPDMDLVTTAALRDPVHEFDLLWDAVDHLLRRPRPPTVICCANDKMALRLYALLRERGLRIPHDISVAGFDDYRVITEHMHPALTTVELPYAAMGARAAEKLLRLIRGEEEPAERRRETVSGPVVWRDSVLSNERVVTKLETRRSKS